MRRLPPAAERIEMALRRGLMAGGAAGTAMPSEEAERAARRLMAAVCEAADAYPNASLPSAARLRECHSDMDRDRRIRALRRTLPAARVAERFGLSERQIHRICGGG